MSQLTINQVYAGAGWQDLIPRTVGQRIILDALTLEVSTPGTVRLRGRSEEMRHYLIAGVPLVLPYQPQESMNDYMTGDPGVRVEMYFSVAGVVTGFVEYHLRPQVSAANTANA